MRCAAASSSRAHPRMPFRDSVKKVSNTLPKRANKTGMPIVVEIMSQTQLEVMLKVCGCLSGRRAQHAKLQSPARLGETRKTILLKRGLSATIEELLMSAEYILAGGNKQVILCERGIRTFETATRNTTDINAIPVLKNLTHLPVILDPSHSTGHADYVAAIARAGIAAGADGLIVEVHPEPPKRFRMASNRSSPKNSPKWSSRSKPSPRSWGAASPRQKASCCWMVIMEDGFSLKDATIGILGLGLMGGSLALSLKGKCNRLIGFDSHPATLELALSKGIIDHASALLPSLLGRGAGGEGELDLLILATPVPSILNI
jgi:3-deoxy-7-phosphoheptulonate synthase